MNIEDVKVKLVDVLQEIQSDSGYETSGISGATCPVTELEGFESPLWPDAIGMLAESLGVDIPHSTNIFVSEDGKRPQTIDESADLVCKVAAQKGS